MVRIAIIDSGINARHPRVGPLAGGIAIAGQDLEDRLGHGTAVAARIREFAPDAGIYAVKVFDRSLACPIETLVRGLEWCIEQRMDFVNVSLGTTNPAHAPKLAEIVVRAALAGVRIVAAADSLPGKLEGVSRASGSASAGSISGVSFAVAELTGHLAAKGIIRSCSAG